MIDFNKWPKIKRLTNERMVVTEKIDGTNGQFYIDEEGTIHVGARNGWISVEKDNMGFAAWIQERKDLILEFFPAGHRYYGEFFGHRINRGYGLKEKKFALFNIDIHVPVNLFDAGFTEVPVLYDGPFQDSIESIIDKLDSEGSVLVPGYNNPEGVIVHLHETGAKYKVFCKGNRDK